MNKNTECSSSIYLNIYLDEGHTRADFKSKHDNLLCAEATLQTPTQRTSGRLLLQSKSFNNNSLASCVANCLIILSRQITALMCHLYA